VLSEKVPVVGDLGDLMYVNFSQYSIGLRSDVRLDASQHVHWTTDEEAFRCILRADGQGTWDAPITPKNGDSLSWCVALAERS
jgi:HK97 family phage major capsid protein